MTDAELVAYRWGQTVGSEQIRVTLDPDLEADTVAQLMPALEWNSLTRLGRRQFRYWALRGAGWW